MVYTPTQCPANVDVEGLRQWVQDEYVRLSRSLQDDFALGTRGTRTNDDARPGMVGEYVSAVAGSVSLVTGVAKTVVALTLTAGDWDVSGGCQVVAETAAASSYDVTIGLTNNTLTSSLIGGEVFDTSPPPFWAVVVGPLRFSLAASTTIYLVTKCVFTGTQDVAGGLKARRVR